ncbi:MAG: SaoD/DsrE family protein [Pseudomonadota bacterium]
MKVAYVFATDMAAIFKLASMIWPQLEDGSHGANVVGMFFFDDNLFCLREGGPAGERLAKIAMDQNILLMICDQCAVRRNLANGTLEQCRKGPVKAKGTVAGVQAGCFPQLYQALAPNAPDFVITI